ncbi:hypothetical protein [Actinosynnema mirum]|uniref:Uncharacterized protein n=1 Tax=Actinosynnema mirum (strain ATCC 29888 / DSM 43827 / JCM 3225 / NBRC 14064 / NCIMB 13271 / NRRL B-12336 / IMRU 3971 / 101) TaxID=446462 RepID=C6WRA4_ACTMD|nr:hypothetical protein [Actinosynnema mirum]ACU35156.1 hypothetical protein Amir_1204 [Actinosynnema mirum DSM 43827]
MGTTSETWVRLHGDWMPNDHDGALGWALWQPGYNADPWPTEELRPSFAYHVCQKLDGGRRAVVAKATVQAFLSTTEVDSPEDAYRLVADELFDEGLSFPPEAWHAHPYNQLKERVPWPQRLTAWRVSTEPVGPHVLSGLEKFPRTGWLRTAEELR